MPIRALLARELASYFQTPLAWLFIIIFVLLSGVTTFYIGGLYERGQADLLPFFGFHPWLHLLLVSAIAMRLWAEERRLGTLEVLLTLPIRLRDAVLAKFLAGWLIIGLALMLTSGLWITVNLLGDPDNGAIFAGYIGSWLLGGAFLAVGSCMSAASSNQVIAFILTIAVGFVYLIVGLPVVLEALPAWLPDWLVRVIGSLSMLNHFEAISRGVLELRDLGFFIVTICAWLLATAIVIDVRKTG